MRHRGTICNVSRAEDLIVEGEFESFEFDGSRGYSRRRRVDSLGGSYFRLSLCPRLENEATAPETQRNPRTASTPIITKAIICCLTIAADIPWEATQLPNETEA